MSPDARSVEPVRLALNPVARVLWRSPQAVQLELGRRSVLVDGLDQHSLRRVLRLHGPDDDAHSDPGSSAAVAQLVDEGFLVPVGHAVTPASPRLAGDVAALGIRYGRRAAAVVTGRQEATVVFYGAGRIGPAVGALLASAGIGHIRFAAAGVARLSHCAAGGIRPRDEGRPFVEAAGAAVLRAAPEADVGVAVPGQAPELAVVEFDHVVDEDLQIGLQSRGVAHLALRCAADHAVAGPLVLPGMTSCLHCADLHRLERDRGWSVLSLQLTVPRRHPPPADSALVGLIAGVAAVQILTHLDGGEPATLEGTLEVQLPDWRLRRRSWPGHPACACGAVRGEPD